MVLEDTSERRILQTKPGAGSKKGGKDDEVCCYYADVQLGLYMVRGDSMVLLGEVEDFDGEDEEEVEGGAALLPRAAESRRYMKKVSLEEFERLGEEARERRESGEEQIEELIWEFDTDLVV
uniref:Uncharacterized protein n=2 Tax=Odontella aurita TaxID=265563 RepID=A0A7S4MW86_9STRA|mmetsp:Transcript_34969/g.104304  ORF Transcript_34969/g.104304 Transcript_34969/m.104304 type:complete len:122 (+) Transcript_34969:237-602(+)